MADAFKATHPGIYDYSSDYLASLARQCAKSDADQRGATRVSHVCYWLRVHEHGASLTVRYSIHNRDGRFETSCAL